MKTLYTGRASTTGGRAGHTETDDGKISLDLAPPSSGKPGTNPEQLFACTYSACFGGAVEAAAKRENVAVTNVKVQADINLVMGDDQGFFLSATLDTTLQGVDQATAEKLVRAAHTICPYSKAIRGNVNVTLKANGQVVKP